MCVSYVCRHIDQTANVWAGFKDCLGSWEGEKRVSLFTLYTYILFRFVVVNMYYNTFYTFSEKK